MPFLQEGSLPRICHYGLLTLALLRPSSAGSSSSSSSSSSREPSNNGYAYGQGIPVTCLNRTIDSGEHITDPLGKLQYIPFPTCNETNLPLTLPYGTPSTITCTIASLPDDLYHLLEYYVHSDVPMTCRVPTGPLTQHHNPNPNTQPSDISVLDTDGPAYTPITFALQGTLQLSHLHIWTGMNLLVHTIGEQQHPKGPAGYVVAGTAYSVPEFDAGSLRKLDALRADGDEDVEGVVREAAREPWTAGHGTKVVRGEPLTFSFHVNWVDGARGIGWPDRTVAKEGGGWFSKVLFFVMAASVGALGALYWERVVGLGGRRRARDGILGVPSRGRGLSVGVGFGNGGRTNGYGGYSSSSPAPGGGGYGYGGYLYSWDWGV
ncbi:hypothetical protein BO71DRAFT_441909 [Aspergillus ellipticus CBS 707.79]|uniref:Uncharacterized protein n=1 Tax=Aspergillus ellipticus CBS 707.79 TaxID=1448320 RepID=A0A319DPP0_9EURO|nr:hypothetical protein BO71DRAFT_441909 [Aspergillus ellipticus CBS 707.79]